MSRFSSNLTSWFLDWTSWTVDIVSWLWMGTWKRVFGQSDWIVDLGWYFWLLCIRLLDWLRRLFCALWTFNCSGWSSLLNPEQTLTHCVCLETLCFSSGSGHFLLSVIFSTQLLNSAVLSTQLLNSAVLSTYLLFLVIISTYLLILLLTSLTCGPHLPEWLVTKHLHNIYQMSILFTCSLGLNLMECNFPLCFVALFCCMLC